MSDTLNALRVAFRHFTDVTTTEQERDAILGALVEHGAEPAEIENAARELFHRLRAREHHAQLDGLITPPPAQPVSTGQA